MRRLLPIALLTLAAGCASVRAQAPIVLQPLEVPPVPPRVIVPDIEEVEPPAPEPATGTAARPAPTRTDPPAKPPEKPVEPPKPGTVDPPKTDETPRVRTPQTADDEQAERAVRAVMGRAQTLLQAVNYRDLSAAAQQQHATAQRFINRADSALRIRNYVFARNLADKAETLARQLGK